jgi:hypothetical protein
MIRPVPGCILFRPMRTARPCEAFARFIFQELKLKMRKIPNSRRLAEHISRARANLGSRALRRNHRVVCSARCTVRVRCGRIRR